MNTQRNKSENELINKLLRRIFGPKGDEVTGERRKLHSGELHNL
jgi:hypothetical protein